MVEHAFDVVFIDLALPEDQALRTAAMVCDLKAKRILGKECAIFLLRAETDPPIMERPEIDGVLTKPLAKEPLEEMLTRWLQKQAAAGQE